MNDTKLSLKAGAAGFALVAVLLTTLTGCVVYSDEPRAGYVVGPTVFVEADDYVYYPSYGVYYSSSRHQYAYLEGRSWVARPAPRGVSVDVLLASPSVRMDFHDSPANHHAAIAKQYPRNWAPPKADQGRPENRGNDNGRDDNRGDRGGNPRR